MEEEEGDTTGSGTVSDPKEKTLKKTRPINRTCNTVTMTPSQR